MSGNGNMAAQNVSYTEAMEHLVDVVQLLSQARTLDDVTGIVRLNARDLTGADGVTFVLRDNEQCYYAEESAITPLWKGRRFPMNVCISGWVMKNAQPVSIEDIYSDPRIPVDIYQPTFVKSLSIVPVRRNNPIATIGSYWAKPHHSSEREMAILQALADTTSVALENIQLYSDLQSQLDIVRQREERIREQRDTLEIFTRSLAHDLKEPVRAICSFAEMIDDAALSDARAVEQMHFLRAAGQRMDIMIRKVFNYTQLCGTYTFDSEDINLEVAIHDALNRLKYFITERGAEIRCNNMPVISINREQAVILIENLISNAIEHSPRPVHIDINAAQTADGDWCISVSDDGPGIAEEYCEKIFNPFFRLERSETNAGLGLTLCRKIVELHGGKISCSAGSQVGTEIRFTLRSPPRASLSIGLSENASPVCGNEVANVLLVDDRDADIYLTRKFLSEPIGMQCNFLVAHDGRSALAVIRKAYESGRPVDLVLLDLNMPGMNGFEMLEEMGQDEVLRRIPVVICSNSDYESDKKKAFTLGALGYLSKPVNFTQLKPILHGIHSLSLRLDDKNVLVLMRAA